MIFLAFGYLFNLEQASINASSAVNQRLTLLSVFWGAWVAEIGETRRKRDCLLLYAQ